MTPILRFPVHKFQITDGKNFAFFSKREMADEVRLQRGWPTMYEWKHGVWVEVDYRRAVLVG